MAKSIYREVWKIPFVFILLDFSFCESECNYDENEAKTIASAKIEADSLNWGEPLYMNFSKAYYTYVFVYDTLGKRAIEVSCKSGSVRILH